jgi:hypothetical protein
MEELVTTESDSWVIYDSDNSNEVIGLLDGDADKSAHDSLNPDNIRISTNKINSPNGDVLYLHELTVNSDGLASRS